MANATFEKDMQLCPHCGQPLYSAKDLEKRVSTPLIFAFEQYEAWKRLKANENEEKLRKVAPKDSSNIVEGVVNE